MKTDPLYSDSLVSITADAIVFENYYFPSGKKKVLPFADIACIKVEPATIFNGRLRIHGTGNLKTWYPRDVRRFQRERIFFVIRKKQWVNIGFTVENADRVEEIFSAMNLLRGK